MKTKEVGHCGALRGIARPDRLLLLHVSLKT